MSVQVDLRPNGTLLMTATSVYGGPPDGDDALRDNDPSTGIQQTVGVPDARFDLETYTLGTARLAAVQVWLLASTGAGLPQFHIVLRESGGTETEVLYVNYDLGGSQVWVPSQYAYVKPTGGEWTQAVLNGLILRLRDDGGGSTNLNIAEAIVRLTVQTKPIVTISSPTSLQTVKLDHLVQWGFNASGDAQQKYRVKVFSVAVAEGGGFDPETSANLYDSAVVSSGATQHTIPLSAALAYNTSYYVYVKAASSFIGGSPAFTDFYSTWSGVKFKTLSRPTVTVTGPTEGSTIITSQPTYTWTYADTDSKVQSKAELRVYLQPGGGWTGFDPDTTTDIPVYQVDDLDGTPHQHVLSFLPNGIYRIYIRVYTTTPFATTSLWDNNTFTINVAGPQQPELTMTPSNNQAYVLGVLQGHVNLLTENQSSIETDATGWGSLGNVTLSRVTTQFSNGIASLQMVRGGSASSMSASIAPTIPNASSPPVASGVQYTARAKFKAAVTARNCRVSISWYNAAFGLISTSDGANVASTTVGWTEATVTATAPALAKYGQVWVTTAIGAAPPAGETHFVDDISLAPGSAVTAPWSIGGRSASLQYLVERSLDNGLTWQTLRGYPASLTDLATQTSDFILDTEVPFNTLTDYRAQLLSVAAGVPVSSTYATDNDNELDISVTWLKDPADNTDAAHFLVQERWLRRSNVKQRTFFQALGRAKPIPYRGSAQNEAFNVSFLLRDQAEFDRLERLLNGNATLLYQTPRKMWYVELAGNYEVQHALWDELHAQPITHIVVCSFQEVDVP